MNLLNGVVFFFFCLGWKSVLNLTEVMGNIMDFEEESVNITVSLLAMSMIDTHPDKFDGLTFGVSAISADLTPQVRVLPGLEAVCLHPKLPNVFFSHQQPKK